MSAAERLLLQHKHLYLNCINTLQEINKFIRPSPSVRPDLVQYLLIRSLNTVGSVRHSAKQIIESHRNGESVCVNTGMKRLMVK